MEHHGHHHDHGHHDHGPDCTCGCHDHGHDGRIRIAVHGVSVAGSVTLTAELEYKAGVREFGRLLSGISREISEQGGIVGHIKALVTDEGRSCMLSVTDEEDASCTDCSAPRLRVEIACIAMALEPEELRHILHHHLKKYL